MAELASNLSNTFFYLIAETCDKGSPVALFFFLSHSLSLSLPFFFLPFSLFHYFFLRSVGEYEKAAVSFKSNRPLRKIP